MPRKYIPHPRKGPTTYDGRWKKAKREARKKEAAMTEEEKTYRRKLQELVSELTILKLSVPMYPNHEITQALGKLIKEFGGDETPAQPVVTFEDLSPEMKAPTERAVLADERRLLELKEEDETERR